MCLKKKNDEVDAPYLFSLDHYDEAEQKAKELNLTPQQWKFVPLPISRFRWNVIQKYHDLPRDHLIGQFDEDEVFWLTGPTL